MNTLSIVESQPFKLMAGMGAAVRYLFYAISDIISIIIEQVPDPINYFLGMCIVSLPWLLELRQIRNKHFNLFTKKYSHLSINLVSFFIEAVLFSVFYFLTLYAFFKLILYFIYAAKLNDGFGLAIGVTVVILLWRTIETRLLPYRFDIKVIHRISSITLVHFLWRHYPNIFGKVEVVSTTQMVSDYRDKVHDIDFGANPFSAVSTALNEAQNNKRHTFDFNDDLSQHRYLLRYHELFGKAGYINFMSGVLVAPLISVIVAAAVAGIISIALQDQSALISDLYDFVKELVGSLSVFNALFFGPAFMPISVDVPLADNGESYFQSVVVARVLFGAIIILAFARGSGTGEFLMILTVLYTAMFFTFIYNYSVGINGNYFDIVALHLQSVEPDNRWLGWAFDYSGFDQLVSQLGDITDEQFIAATVPGLIFWVVSCVGIYLSVYHTWSGNVTYRNRFVMPYVSRGNKLSEDKEPLLTEVNEIEAILQEQEQERSPSISVNSERMRD